MYIYVIFYLNKLYKFKSRLLSSKPAFYLLQYASNQGCGIGRDVSVSRRSRDVLTSHLDLIAVSKQYVSVSAQ